jgi:N-acetylglutamate synthase-like GNAT family acetyltransferase
MPSRPQSADAFGSKARLARRGEPVLSKDDRLEIARAHAGDHGPIHELLLAVCQRPSVEEFQASLDDPHYDPTDRLLIRRDGRVVSHVQLKKRRMRFGQARLPVAEVEWLATLPEYRSAGYALALLEEADRQMRAAGAVLAVLQTDKPELFARLGWISCGRPAYMRVKARDLLAHLTEQTNNPRHPPLATRMFRLVELRPLMRLYEQRVAGRYGPLERDEAYWRWLVNRQAYEHFIVAIEGDDSRDFGEQAPELVGYAVTRGERIVELAPRADHPAAARLLARACRDAIERDHHSLLVHAPPDGPLGDFLAAAGGAPCACPGRDGEMAMLKVLDRDELLRRLFPELQQRAIRLASPFELRLNLDGRPWRFALTRRGAKLEPAKPGAADLRCASDQFDQLLLGQLDLDAALAQKTIKVRTKTFAKHLRELFPILPFWRPPFDGMQA